MKTFGSGQGLCLRFLFISQKSEIKKLTNDNDSLRRELSRHKGMRKFVTETPDAVDTVNKELDDARDKLSVSEAKLRSLKDHITSTAAELMTVLDDDSDFTKVCRRKRVNTKSAQNHDENHSVTDRHDVSQSQPQVPKAIINGTSRNNGRKRRSSVDKVVLIGTSLVRGQGSALNKAGVDAMCYTYPGCEIPFIRSRVRHILTESMQPKKVHLLCGGNDASSRDSHLIVKQYDDLIREVRKCCPGAQITVNTIPPRRRDRRVLERIEQVNTYLRNRGQRGDGVTCLDEQPHFPSHFSDDKVHFNNIGKATYAKQLADYYVNFPPLPRNIRR